MVSTTFAPGWYRDPASKHELRYWDGRAWTAYVADQGRLSQDGGWSPPPTARRVPGAVKGLVVVVVIAALALVGAGFIAVMVDSARGTDPLTRLRRLHNQLTAAGVVCEHWSQHGPRDAIGSEDYYDATCTLASGNVVRITTFREAKDKSGSPPCPRLEGETFWIDTLGIRDGSELQRIAAALSASIVSDCATTGTS